MDEVQGVGSKLGRQTAKRETNIRQAKVLSVQTGPPRSVTVDLAGKTFVGIRLLDSVTPVVNQGLWLADIGMGRWLGIGTSNS